MNPDAGEVARLADFLSAARRLLVFTGAGISTASGIPDFRGPQGVWKRRQPVYLAEFLESEAKRIEHWDFKLEGWPSIRGAVPNAVHEAVAQLGRAGRVECVLTQNIDGLHQKAGTSVDRLVEIHGTNLWIECLGCGRRSEPQPVFDLFASTRRPPVCGECGGWLKPATISFGQSLKEESLRRAGEAARMCDAVIALGSTLSVYPAAMFPLDAASRGAPYAIINQGETGHDGESCVTLRIEGDVGASFPAAVRLVSG